VIKALLRRAIHGSVRLARKTQIGRYRHDVIVSTAMQEAALATHGSMQFRFAVPNALCRYRAETFATKEPETLEWIDAIPERAVLWDVGANVGLYSIYAACKRKCQVLAFEPSVFNLELLARNVELNGVGDRICIVPLALNDALGPSEMRMTTTEWGGSLSTFGHDVGWDGKAVRKVFGFQTLGLTMEDAVQRLGLPQPDYIKMDVDGIEHVILAGGPNVLRAVCGVLIEVNDDFREQAEESARLLAGAGLKLVAKRHSNVLEQSTTGFNHTFNQIWARD
jgi:FkbM family methyltransferase